MVPAYDKGAGWGWQGLVAPSDGAEAILQCYIIDHC